MSGKLFTVVIINDKEVAVNYIEKSLDAFFSSEAKVIVIKGDWGVGKTYFWERYIEQKIESKSLKQLAYSYISLFGKSSLDEIRRQVFHNAKSIASEDLIIKSFNKKLCEPTRLYNKAPWFNGFLIKLQSKAPWINIATKNVQHIPFINKFSGMVSSLEYSLVNNYVICIDDIERKGKGLSIKDVMGLVDELAQRKLCKVILIFNEKSFDSAEDKAQFDSYREKVVDIEMHHNPSCLDNLHCIFPSKENWHSELEKIVNHLQIKNIRVLRKIKLLVDHFDKYINERDHRIAEEFVFHAALHCWSFYIKDSELNYETFKKLLSTSSWLSFFIDEKKQLSEGEKKYKTLASSIDLRRSVFDEHISFFLENGYVDDEALNSTVKKLEEKIRIDSVSSRLKDAWNIYSESFSDNLIEFKKSLIDILNEEMKSLELSDFSSAVDILEEFDVDVTDFVNRYVELKADSLLNIDSRSLWNLHRFRCPLLKDKIDALQINNKSFNIDDVALRIVENNGWTSEDVKFLNSLTKDDYVVWMKGSPQELATKIRSGLFIFRDLGASNGEQDMYKNITSNVVDALKELASENALNKYRVRHIYGIE